MPHVLIVAGGLSHERDVSLRSGRRVADALTRDGFDVQVRDVDSSLVRAIDATRPDVVWPLLHGTTGEDGSVRDVLESKHIRYVGPRPAACRLTWDKPVAKAIVERAGIATPRGVALSHATFRELGAATVLDALVQSLGLPLVVKPARGGSALGLGIIRRAEQLPAAMIAAYAYGDIALVEKFITGTEVTVAVVEDAAGRPQALPAVEIVPDGGIYSYEARYTAGATEFFTPARLSPRTAGDVASVALAAWACLGHRHLSRIDLIVDPDGRPWFLEGNVSPGLTETSLVPMAAAAAGLDGGALYARVVERTLAGPDDPDGVVPARTDTDDAPRTERTAGPLTTPFPG